MKNKAFFVIIVLLISGSASAADIDADSIRQIGEMRERLIKQLGILHQIDGVVLSSFGELDEPNNHAKAAASCIYLCKLFEGIGHLDPNCLTPSQKMFAAIYKRTIKAHLTASMETYEVYQDKFPKEGGMAYHMYYVYALRNLAQLEEDVHKKKGLLNKLYSITETLIRKYPGCVRDAMRLPTLNKPEESGENLMVGLDFYQDRIDEQDCINNPFLILRSIDAEKNA